MKLLLKCLNLYIIYMLGKNPSYEWFSDIIIKLSNLLVILCRDLLFYSLTDMGLNLYIKFVHKICTQF